MATGNDATRKRIKLALHRLQVKRSRVVAPGRKLSIAAVAQEAGVSAATIHNTYPDLAEEIRLASGRATRAQRDRKHEELQRMRRRIRELRQQLQESKSCYENLASENARLLSENLTLRAVVAAGNVASMPRKS